jgi:penicillin amidase
MRKKTYQVVFFCFLALIFLVTSAGAEKDSEITIKRDNYGVPHIYAQSIKGLYYGYGYAVAQDRLYQIEMFRRTFWGRLTEVYGQDLLAFDQSNRRDNLTRDEITRQISNLDPEVKTAMRSFAAGINAYIVEALVDRNNKLPKEFHQFGFDPELWTSEDVAADFLSVMGFFMDLTGELANASMLSYLANTYDPEKAQAIFDDWCWGLDPDSPTTIVGKRKQGHRDGKHSEEAHLNHPLMASILKASRGAETAWVKERLEHKLMLAKAFPYGHPSSYAVVIGPKKSATGKPMLMGGPQFDYELPSALYEVGLHGGGIDAVGSTLAGYPFIMFGYNRRAAFSSTAGADNIEDVFAEKLNPGNPRQYWFKGKWKEMEVRTETFLVKNGSPVTVEFLYTVHGPVFYVDEANHVAFSKKLSCREGFLQGITSFYNLMKAETVNDFNKAAKLSDMSINYFFANVDGDIAYYHLGLHPVRAKGVDVRLPTPGTGEFEWQGFIPKSQNPHQSNPAQGYFVNWNNQPEPGWGHGDLATTDLWGGWGADSRVTNLIRLVEDQAKLDSGDLKTIIKNIAFYDKRALNIKALLLDAVKDVVPKSTEAIAAIALLDDWNNLNIDEAPKDGFYDDAGSALFNAWWGKAVSGTFGSWFAGYQNAVGKSAVDILSNLYLGYTLFYRALNGTTHIDYFNGQKGQIIYTALSDALAEMNYPYTMPTMMWQYFPLTILGFYFGQPVISSVGSLPPFPYVDRGTENHIVMLNHKGISGENITPPGNSAFIRADGTRSQHFADQDNMFQNFTYKPMLFKNSQINGALESTQILHWK